MTAPQAAVGAGFLGGLTLPGERAQTLPVPTRRLPLPPRLFLALDRHVGLAAQPVVAVGDTVKKGDLLARAADYVSAAIHAPTSGVIEGIQTVPRPEGGTSQALVLAPDGLDAWGERPAPLTPETAPAEVCLERIAAAGLIGLGGAGFPTAVKLAEGGQEPVKLLVVNAVECEPMLSCDQRLVLDDPAAVLRAAQLLGRLTRAQRLVLALEEENAEAIAALSAALEATGDADTLELAVVANRYPAGAERQLIRTLTGIALSPEELPIHHGVIVQNVATAVAAYRAVAHGEPLIERYVTVAGAVAQPGNLIVPLGTPVRALLDACGREPQGTRLRVGGPLTGFDVTDEAVPVDKRVGCVVVAATPPAPERACIRCGECLTVCPSGLQPQALNERLAVRDFDTAQDFDLFACIECGLCDHVCPSRIPLTASFRAGKREIERMDRVERQADAARRQGRERVANDRRRAELVAARKAARRAASAPPEAEASSAAAEAKTGGLLDDIRAAVNRTRARRARRSDDKTPNGEGKS